MRLMIVPCGSQRSRVRVKEGRFKEERITEQPRRVWRNGTIRRSSGRISILGVRFRVCAEAMITMSSVWHVDF